jgi:hypothetical protein
MVRGERRGDRRPHVARVAEAMQENDGRSLAADPDMDRGVFRLHVLALKTCWKRQDWHDADLRF